MTLFGYRFLIRFAGLVGLLSLLLFVFGTDPQTLSPWGLALFFLSLLLTSSSFFSLVLLALARRFIGEDGTLRSLGSLLRQAMLLGLLVFGLALLLFFSLLAWWNVLLMIAFLLLIELSFRSIFSHS